MTSRSPFAGVFSTRLLAYVRLNQVNVDLGNEVTFANQPLGCFRAHVRLFSHVSRILSDLVGKPWLQPRARYVPSECPNDVNRFPRLVVLQHKHARPLSGIPDPSVGCNCPGQRTGRQFLRGAVLLDLIALQATNEINTESGD
jgi:hypothetical protein